MDLPLSVEHRAKVAEFQRQHQTRLLALLFTDIVGSTRLKKDLGDFPAVTLIQDHHALVRRVLSRYVDAAEIETAGDSFFIVFVRPSEAVKFALELQSQLRRLAVEKGHPVLDRMGIHVGEVVVEEHEDSAKPRDLYGSQVDTCARVMSLAQGDQILCTRAAFDNARSVLKGGDLEGIGGLSWVNHGPYFINDLDSELEICEVGETGKAVLRAPITTQKVSRRLPPNGPSTQAKRASRKEKTPRAPIRVILADDHPIVRSGIRAELERFPEVEVVGEASDGREAIELVKTQHPDVAFIDISMKGLNGLEATTRITRDFPHVRVIILSMHEQEMYFWGALKAGASGYLLKQAATTELAGALHRVLDGEIYLSRQISTQLVRKLPSQQTMHHEAPLEHLTERQREILQLIAEGQTTKTIADILRISPKSVEYHRAKIMDRLNIHDIPGLIRFSLHTGLIAQE